MAPASRAAIPVPLGEEQGAAGGSRGGLRPAETNNGRRVNVDRPAAQASRAGMPANAHRTGTQTQARRPSQRDAGQAPWRSSLDLVWSYSRSQAFYGDNFATSPSFADHRWAGPSNAAPIDSSVEATSEGETDEFDESDYEEEEEDEEGQGHGIHGTGAYRYDDVVAASPAGRMDWQEEQLPPNAVQRPPRRSALGRRERRGSRDSSPGRRGSSSVASAHPGGPSHTMDRNLRRIVNDSVAGEDEERSRSRSRSPKRVSLSQPLSRVRDSLRSTPGAVERPREGGQEGAAAPALRSIRSSLSRQWTSGSDGKDRGRDRLPADERSPLLQRRRIDQTARQAGQVEFDDEEPWSLHRPTALRTPSWFRNSGVSTASAKFRNQGYGSSTFWQSWFNTLNALIGIGILALPLAISYAGLIPGVAMFLLSGLVTNYTGKVLALIMAAEPSLRTYADIGNLAFGPRARLLVSFFFCLELWAVSTALLILFGDSVHALVLSAAARAGHGSTFLDGMAHWPSAAFKLIGIVIVLPTMFLPLRWLSPISVIGIVSVVTLFGVVLSDGLIKHEAPGSLWQPMPIDLTPRWRKFPLSFGLIMSGFSSHPIIPSLFKDMRNPRQFRTMLNWAYVAATVAYLAMGLIGYLMFGRSVSDEITRDLAHTSGYPQILNRVAIWLIIINPLSKFALAARPIVTTVELILGVEPSQAVSVMHNQPIKAYGTLRDPIDEHISTEEQPLSLDGQRNDLLHPPSINRSLSQAEVDPTAVPAAAADVPEDSPLAGSSITLRAAQRTAQWSPRGRSALRVAIQITLTVAIGTTAIILPGFEKVMAFLGAFLACVTCIFGPLLARLRLLRREMSTWHVMADCALLLIFSCLAVVGTVWSFLPSA